MANINEYSIVSWNPVGSAKYTVKLTTPAYSPIHTVSDHEGSSIAASILLLDAGVPRAGVTQGSAYKILVYTQGAFGLGDYAEIDVTVQGAPAPTGLAVS
jgi:hypothetical protein